MLFTKSIRYPITFDLISGRTELDSDTISINRCIALILTTGKGELLGDPDFGCRLYEMLFDQYSEQFEQDVKKEIVDSLTMYEHRISVKTENISIKHIEDTDRNSYSITISYTINGSSITNSTDVVIEEGIGSNG